MNIEVTICGSSPLLCNKFTDAAMMKMESGTSSAMVGQKGLPREQAESRLYLDSKGCPVIPGPNIFRSIIDAGTYHKAGKSKITTGRSSMVPAGIALNEIECRIFDSTGGAPLWECDSRAVVIPSTGGRVMSHRPRFDDWRIAFTLEVDVSMFDVPIVRMLVDDAGRRIGLGDFRPARKGPFGRFKVTSWVVNGGAEKPNGKA